MFSTESGWICLVGGLAAHRICLQEILKHGIMAKGMSDRKTLETGLEWWKKDKKVMEALGRGPQLPGRDCWERMIRETFTGRNI